MQSIYTYIPETPYVPREYSVAAILLLLFMVLMYTVHTTYAAALKTTTHPKTRCRKPYAAIQHLMLLKMDVCTRNMSS